MAQQPVELILVRQLAGYLSVPVLVADPTETVVFYNEPAEQILGIRFEETGPVSPEEADRLVELSDDPEVTERGVVRPMLVALRECRPAHARRWLRLRKDGVRFEVEITAFPLIGQDRTLLGAVVMFWKRHQT
jgi:PAS domain-containing protein